MIDLISLILVTHVSAHHADHSGYDKLANHLCSKVISGSRGEHIPYRVRKLLSGWVPASKNILYDSRSVAKELEVLANMLHTRMGVVHFLHVEHDYYFTRWWKYPLGWKTAGTFHAPPSVLVKRIPEPSYLKSLDALFCVGRNQIPYLKEIVSHDRVWFVPHGVDTEFFYPTLHFPAGNRAIFVGQHLRDFKTLEQVAEGLRQKIKDFELIAVVKPEYVHLLPKHSWVKPLSNISDTALREKYHSASLLLIPLLDATACNSILEALACGLPVVSTDVGGVRDYVDDTCSRLVEKGDSEGLAEAASELMLNRELNRKMRQQARLRALKFSWSEIAALATKKYRQMLEIHR